MIMDCLWYDHVMIIIVTVSLVWPWLWQYLRYDHDDCDSISCYITSGMARMIVTLYLVFLNRFLPNRYDQDDFGIVWYFSE
jgi:Ca2+/H+ antiporter